MIERAERCSTNKLSIEYLCKLANVSRSGYYNWKANTHPNQMKREEQDRADFELILKAYHHGQYQNRPYAKGRRAIRMTLLHMGVVMNTKKIRRLMKKFGLKCTVRKPNPYKKMMKANQEHRTAPNLVQRQFKAYGPRKIILTDITYIFYGKSQKAYLSVMKDGYTNEILAYVLCNNLKVNFVLETVDLLVKNHGDSIEAKKCLIHSDQGVHYTSQVFQKKVKEEAFVQSMSRKANCWDNAPQESFFGHMKDELVSERYETFEELKEAIDGYMDYYNNNRYQEGLAKLAPTQYYRFYTTGHYPLADLIGTPEIKKCRVLELELEVAEV